MTTNSMPSGAESALLEAGFSPTEVAVIQRLLQHDALTLRGLASATGKSTGVLDQATKKLLQKQIIQKEMINNAAKFTITSMDSVLRWMEDDAKHKHALMARRQQNFESFIRTLEHDKKRPVIEYFDGIDGLAQAYRKLLDCGGKEILGYVPVFCSIEDDPLRDFKVEWFRNRRKKGIFSRIITHDTPLGRRYLSRDIFEYRQTILVDEKEYPFTFEKIICGDCVACFNYVEKRACLLRYPEMAAMERSLFESLWRQINKKEKAPSQQAISPGQGTGAAVLALPSSAPMPVPLRVRAFSGLREFFVSRKSIAAFCGIAVVSAGITFSLYRYTKDLQFQQMLQTVKSIAATGAFQFNPADLDALQDEKDWGKPELKKVGEMLQKIRKNNDDINFAYIVRKVKSDPIKMEFVADADSINPYANTDNDPTNNVDMNGDGKIDAADEQTGPGHPYTTAPPETFDAYNGPTTTHKFYEDQWGKFISGYAPIKDTNGRVAGVLAIDMTAKLLDDRIAAVFQPILYFIGFFLVFVLIRLAAFNRSLFTELWKGLNMRKVLVVLTLSAEITFAVTFGLYQYMLRQTINDMGSRTMAIVATAASQFNPQDLEQLHWSRDMKTAAYQRVYQKLNSMRDANPKVGIRFAYIYRHNKDDANNILTFIADADSNYYLPSEGPDFNGDGILDEADENISPGQRYFVQSSSQMLEAFQNPIFSKNFYSDQWGNWISAYAPIKDFHNETYAILGADVDASVVLNTLHKRFVVWMWFAGVLCVALFLIWVRKIV